MGKKFAYADKLGIRYVSVLGGDEKASGILKVKDMRTGGQTEFTVEQCIKQLKK